MSISAANPRPLRLRIGRIPITKISPVIESGAYPSKATVGELIPISARIFREGHDAVNANVVLTDPNGKTQSIPLHQAEPWGLDIWKCDVRLDQMGLWTYRIEAWSDPWQTWVHNAEIKLSENIDVELVCLEGRQLIKRVLRDTLPVPEFHSILQLAKKTLHPNQPIGELLNVVRHPALNDYVKSHPIRDFVTPSLDYQIFCDRELARCSAWYEFFPRSAGAHKDGDGNWVSGTFKTAEVMLDHAANMGFDVVYLPPIHPIGYSYRKGKNNTLNAGPDQPGSCWAIGNADGGHDAIHPELGTAEDFQEFVQQAHRRGLEVALDLALQASPDHPWVQTHPEWFAQRADGSIAYAENPPKKYQDIYPLNFDRDASGISQEILRLVLLWVSRGVTIFRVDNPHTKPVMFWAWLISEVKKTHPEVLFLAEAFTRPEMMQMLGKVGFSMSYTYFTWRSEKWELEQYLHELTQDLPDFFRPSFWTNTPDINPVQVHNGQPAAFALRAVLASTLVPNWGMYSGFELCEHALFRSEEYLNSEKYEYRPRDLSARPNIIDLITKLNWARKQHPALRQLRNITFHSCTNSDVIAYSKREGEDVILVICAVHANHKVDSWVDLNMEALNLAGQEQVEFKDLLTGERFSWSTRGWVGFDENRIAHVMQVFPHTNPAGTI